MSLEDAFLYRVVDVLVLFIIVVVVVIVVVDVLGKVH